MDDGVVVVPLLCRKKRRKYDVIGQIPSEVKVDEVLEFPQGTVGAPVVREALTQDMKKCSGCPNIYDSGGDAKYCQVRFIFTSQFHKFISGKSSAASILGFLKL